VVQKVKEARKEGKWAIIRNRKVVIRDRVQNKSDKKELGTLWILFWNCHGFPWHKGPMLSWILIDIDLILLVETWEHEESRVPHIDGFILWSTWNKKSSHRGFGCIACYIKTNMYSHIQLHKINPFN